MTRHARLFTLTGLALLLLLEAGCPSKTTQAPADPNDRAAAIARAEAALKASPQDKDLKQNLIILLLQNEEIARGKKDYPAAQAALDHIFSVAPEHPYALYAQGRLLIEQGKAGEGVPKLEQLVALNPRFSADLYNQLAAGYIALGDRAKAREALLKSLSLSPASIKTYKTLAEVYRMEGNEGEAQRQDAAAADVEKYGYPDRGYQSKTLADWMLDAAAFGSGPGQGMGLHEGGTAEPAEGSTTDAGPDAGRLKKALALYNIAVYKDHEIDPNNPLTYEDAQRAWQAYVQFTRGIDAEVIYRGIAKDRVEAIKQRKKAKFKELGVMALEETLGKSRKLNKALRNMTTALPKVKAAAEAAGDAESAAQAQAILDKLVEINIMSYQDRLREINHTVKSLIGRRVQKDPAVTDELINSEAKRMGAELETMQAELRNKGIDQQYDETTRLTSKYRIRMPKHAGEEAPAPAQPTPPPAPAQPGAPPAK